MEITIETYNVTELNTRKKVFKNALKDIFEGDNYKTHEFETLKQAKEFEKQLNERGVMTNLTHVFRQKKINSN